MRKIYVCLYEEEFKLLQEISAREIRDLNGQLRYFIVQALKDAREAEQSNNIITGESSSGEQKMSKENA